MYICLCRGVTERQIQDAINKGFNNYSKIRSKLQVGMQCGKCACHVKQIVKETVEIHDFSHKSTNKIAENMYVAA